MVEKFLSAVVATGQVAASFWDRPRGANSAVIQLANTGTQSCTNTVEGSMDGSVWSTLVSSAALAAATSTITVIPDLPYLRVNTTALTAGASLSAWVLRGGM